MLCRNFKQIGKHRSLGDTNFVKIDEKLTKINNTYNPSRWKGGKNNRQFGNFAVTLAFNLALS